MQAHVGGGVDEPRSVADHRDAVNVLGDQPRGGILKGFAPVGRAPHAADLEPGEDEVRVVRIEGDLRDARPHHRRAGLGERRIDAFPGFRTVGRAEDARRPSTGEDQVGIVRRARDRPDAQAVHRRGQVGPPAARDVEPVDAGIGAGEQLIRALRVRGERPDPRLAVHSRGSPETLQRFAEVVAVPDGQSRRADIEARRHASLPCGVLVFDTGDRPARGAMMNPAPNRRQCVAAKRIRLESNLRECARWCRELPSPREAAGRVLHRARDVSRGGGCFDLAQTPSTPDPPTLCFGGPVRQSLGDGGRPSPPLASLAGGGERKSTAQSASLSTSPK